MWFFGRALCLLLSFSIFFAAMPAVAQPKPNPANQKRAEQLKTEGDVLMDSLHFDDALKKYTEAYDLTHDPVFLYNRGRAYEALTDYPAAVEQLDRFVAEAPAAMKARVPKLDELVADVHRKVSTLTVKCGQGARVILREKTIGNCPIAPVKVNAGTATLEVTADSFQTSKQTITLPPGSNLDLDITLLPLANTGILVIHATPNATSSVIDNNPGSGTPLELTVAAGRHSVLLLRDGYVDLSASADVARGERKVLDLKLESKPGILSKWWFWTIVVVVVGAGVGIAIAATTERPADEGDIPPKKITGP